MWMLCTKQRAGLAVQILSSSVAKVLNEYGPPESTETARFYLMMDSFLI